jgi:hypothetical protein
MVHGAHLFILLIEVQEGLEQVAVVGRDGANFVQCSTVRGGFPQAKGSGCHRV